MKEFEYPIWVAAKGYLFAHAKACMFDNYEDVEMEGKWKHTFEFLSSFGKQPLPIHEYIRINLALVIDEAKQLVEDYGEAWNEAKLCKKFLGE